MLEKAKKELDFLKEIMEDDYLVLLDVATNIQLIIYDIGRHLLVPRFMEFTEFKEIVHNEDTADHILENLNPLLEKYVPLEKRLRDFSKKVTKLHLYSLESADNELDYKEMKDLLEELGKIIETIEGN